jgi:hypothetical protein
MTHIYVQVVLHRPITVIVNCISFLRYNDFPIKLTTLFSELIKAMLVIITNVLRGFQRKPDKLEMSELLCVIHLIIINKMALNIFLIALNRSEVIALLLNNQSNMKMKSRI